MTTSERIHWAVSLLDIQPTDRVLEIGCGAGLAVEQIAQKADFAIIQTIFKALPPAAAFCIIAQPVR